MEGRSIFVFFMIFNAILGLTGLASLGAGIALIVTNSPRSPDTKTKSNGPSIAMIVIGAYITTILILGACSWKKAGVLIAYFVLIILSMLAELIMIILIKVAEKSYEDASYYTRRRIRQETNISLIIYGVSLGIAFLSFLFSTIYFCLMRNREEQKLLSDVRNMEYINMPQIQNV